MAMPKIGRAVCCSCSFIVASLRRPLCLFLTDKEINVLTNYVRNAYFLARLLKEVAYYKQEVKDNEAKLEEMKRSNKDVYDIKQFEKVLDESYMMVPDSERRLKQALGDLSLFFENSDATIDKTGTWYTTADQILKENCGEKDEENTPKTNVDDIAEGEPF